MRLTILKKTALFLVLCFTLNLTYSQDILTGTGANDYVKGAELVRTSKYSEVPSYIRFKTGFEKDLDSFFPWFKKVFSIDNAVKFNFIRSERDDLGHVHYRYSQSYNGVKIEHSTWILHTKNGMVYSANGMIHKNLEGNTGGISENEALNKAKDYVGADLYKWELPEEEAHVKWETNDPNATYYPEGELVYVTSDYSYTEKSYRLAYKFNIYAQAPLFRGDIYVDAATGEIIYENEMVHHANETGTASTVYSGNQSIVADSFGGGYRLRETTRGNGVNTYDMNEGTSYGASVDFTDIDNFWDNVNANLDEYATDAHWGAEMTYDYFFLQHGRNSIDGNGFALNSYVHYDNNYANAFWDGQRMTYGDGDGAWNPLTALDIAGHEITHGLTTFTADLVYQAESGALNESFSDIFGTCVENYARPANWNWLVGEDIGSALRSMSNPNAYGDPDTYFGNNWASLTGGDNGGVHTNSGVQNFWFYLLTQGGTGTNDNSDAYSVNGQGFTKASSIAFRNLTVYLTDNSDYADARFYSIQSAVDLYGACSPEVEATTDAWYAVGVGGPYVSEVIAAMSPSGTESCSAPFTVNFSNTSNNGQTFEWDFGDGNTSSDVNPSHTYTADGTYTVELIADGGACGMDTTLYVDLIIVDGALPCAVDLPPNGTANTQTACSGTIYDSGGSTDSYGPDEDAVITVSPNGASTVDLTFVNFDVEVGSSGSNCDYDYLEVYDGPSTASPLIDRYCNGNPPPATISSTSSSITLYFHSDPGLEETGFEITWDCVLPNVPPVTSFESNVQTSCNGTIQFTDMSTEGPTSWTWDFGDGNTSSDQNPVHTYTADGTYTVELTSTNGIGSDTHTEVNYIVIDLPDAPAGTGDNVCANNPADLTATANAGGDLIWYDASTGGNELGAGSSFTTSPVAGTTSFFVEESIPGASQNLGPADNSFGGGGYFNGNQHLVFDVTEPVILNSVRVFANGSGLRTIELRDNAGTVLQSLTVDIPDGESVVQLGFDLPVGTDLQLGTLFNSQQDLYRNNSGCTYPYTVGGGEVVITESSPGINYYYFFYDWEIQAYPCVSPRTEVIVNVTPQADATINPQAGLCSTDSPVTMSAAEAGGTWSGTGITGDQFDPSTAGIGSHQVIYEITGACGNADTTYISVSDGYDATITAPGDQCAQGGTITLTGANSGGTWTGTGILDPFTGEFDPNAAGIGTHEIIYTFNGTCGDADTIDIEVLDNADATINDPGVLCESNGPIQLTSQDIGGVWSGTGITNGSTGEFDPSAAGIGTFNVNYTIAGTCGDSDDISITVAEDADATILPAGPFCREGTVETINSVNPGGLWSADCGTCINAVTGEFNPTVSGMGTWTITYIISGQCPDTSTTSVSVLDCLGIEEVENSNISIYPNPTFGLLTINTGDIETGKVVIRDPLGRIVLNENFNNSIFEIELNNNVADGTYFVSIYTTDGKLLTVRHIIKN